MRKLTSFMFNLVIAMILVAVTGLPALAAPAIAVLGGMTHQVPGLSMAIQKEIWETDIVANLFADNSFLSKAYNADMFVLQGKVVHIPYAGAASSVTKNRSEFPAVAVSRTDADITYSLDEYTTAPRRIEDAANYELSYNKRQSIISEDRAALIEAIANEMVYNWSPTSSTYILRTTGSAVLAHMPSATGNRKAFTKSDISAAKKLMNKTNIPKQGRYMLIDSDMYEQLLDSLTAQEALAFHAQADVANGTIGKLHGFEFYERSSAGRYTNATPPVPRLTTAAAAATDNAAAIAWQQDCVERALGAVKAFEQNGDPTYFGDVLSFLLRAGGRIRRNDAKGVIAIVQAASE
jgi:hypothetical protein